ncbi:hypothetical protein [Rubritalea marina]|uniref:hypothetical protein n=1 Tax=Rubritalea marina TaxID=361055 RepID=UPI0003A9DF1B|nr:hypothetical protein [Rubritalea marina]
MKAEGIDEKRLRILLKDCATGFYQQMYFLGKDVMHPSGNQLEAFGFKKTPSKGLKGTSCYTLERDGLSIELHGSCAAAYTHEGSVVFLRKRNSFYSWLPEEPVVPGKWTQDDIRRQPPCKMLESLCPLLEWWIEYEAWIADRLPASYRKFCQSEWRKLKSMPVWLTPETAPRWVEGLITNKDQQARPRHFELANAL